TQTLWVVFSPTDARDYTTVLDSVTIRVKKATSTTAITSNTASPSRAGQSVTVTFSVTGTGTPTGSARVTAGTGEACSGTLNSGNGSCALVFLTRGTRTLTAAYAGDDNFKKSISLSVMQVVHGRRKYWRDGEQHFRETEYWADDSDR